MGRVFGILGSLGLLFLMPCLAAAPERGANAMKPAELRPAATIHSVGFEWDIEGDANHNATCVVRYRPKHAASAWKQAMPLLRIDYWGWYDNKKTRAYRPFNMFAGSLMFLEPGTEYEVELTATDPDGGGEKRTLTLRTRAVPRLAQRGRTLHVVPGAGGGEGSKARPFRGMQAAEAAARPGDVFLLHKGEYPACTLTKSGEPQRYIAWKAAGDGAAVLRSALVVRADHLWIEGLTFEPTAEKDFGGVRGEGHGHDDLVIVRNRFRNCRYALSNTDQEWDGNPAALDRGWYVADNVMAGGPFTEYGLRVYMLADSDVCYNRITTTLNEKGGDGISLRYCLNIDVYNNDLRDIDDDGFEPDGAYANIRIWRNRLVNPRFQAVSFQPMLCSPWYIVRNEFVLTHADRHATVFKNNAFDRFVVVNNTFVVRGRYAQAHADIVLRTVSRNNLWIHLYDNPDERTNPGGALWYGYGDSPDQQYSTGGQTLPDWKTDVDYDGFAWDTVPGVSHPFWWTNPSEQFRDVASFAAAKGIERHAVRVDRGELFAVPDLLAYAREPFSTSRLTLAKNSSAIDAGQPVPDLCEKFAGKAPDLGAYEYGRPLPHYGPRPRARGENGRCEMRTRERWRRWR